MNTRFFYYRSEDGVDETWDIRYPSGEHLVSIHFWEKEKETQAEAELIVRALNHYIRTEEGAEDLAKCLRANGMARGQQGATTSTPSEEILEVNRRP